MNGCTSIVDDHLMVELSTTIGTIHSQTGRKVTWKEIVVRVVGRVEVWNGHDGTHWWTPVVAEDILQNSHSVEDT